LEERFDVVIVGSGYGGSIPALRLAEAGMSVLVLERGPRYATSDLQQSDDPRYITRIVDVVVSTGNIGFRTGTMVGGASIPMDGAHFRMPAASFETMDGARRRWPSVYTRPALDPYYDRAETMLRVRQFAWDEISKAGGLFAKMLDSAGASCERSRMNYTDCVHCGFCAQGCVFDKKMTLLHTYIPAAETAGAIFRPGCMVDHVEASATEYVVYYARDGATHTACAPRLILACGGIHTPALLLRSASYLPLLSAHVGRNFNNNGEHGFIGILPPEFDDLSTYYCYKGMDNAGMMTFHWMASEGFSLHPGGGIEPSVFAAAIEAADHPVLPRRSWGMEYKRFVESVFPHRVIAFSSLGLADGHRSVVLRTDGSPDFHEEDRTAFDAYLDRLEGILDTVAAVNGVTLVPAYPRSLAGQTSAHLLSACRMAESIADGVCDADGQVFGYPNLYITDASAIPYALGVNPALTISAVAERKAETIVARG
jgi:choline dehydrogenase-like flavoprotein